MDLSQTWSQWFSTWPGNFCLMNEVMILSSIHYWSSRTKEMTRSETSLQLVLFCPIQFPFQPDTIMSPMGIMGEWESQVVDNKEVNIL